MFFIAQQADCISLCDLNWSGSRSSRDALALIVDWLAIEAHLSLASVRRLAQSKVVRLNRIELGSSDRVQMRSYGQRLIIIQVLPCNLLIPKWL